MKCITRVIGPDPVRLTMRDGTALDVPLIIADCMLGGNKSIADEHLYDKWAFWSERERSAQTPENSAARCMAPMDIAIARGVQRAIEEELKRRNA